MITIAKYSIFAFCGRQHIKLFLNIFYNSKKVDLQNSWHVLFCWRRPTAWSMAVTLSPGGSARNPC
jgi:hypothetical protein